MSVPPPMDCQPCPPSRSEIPFDFRAWLAAWQQEYVFFRINARRRIDYIAPSVRHILGYEPEEMLGRDFRDFFDLDHPLHARLLDLSDRESFDDPPHVRRSIARRRDGKLAFFAIREREIVVDGQSQGREFMAMDVTARIEAELSVRQSERKYRRLVEGLRSDYVIYARNARGTITYVSPSVQEVLGFEPDELIGSYAGDVYDDPQEGRSLVERFTRESEAGKTLHRAVVQIKHRDGGARTLEIHEHPVFSLHGRLVSIEGIGKDVTEAIAADRQIRQLKEDLERRVALRTEELSRMNEELRASESRYRDVVETLGDFIVRWLPDGTQTFVNDAYCRFHGQSRADLIGESLILAIHADDRDAFERAVESIAPSNPSTTCEIRTQCRRGDDAWVQWSTRGKFDPSGRLVEYQSVGRNVTELKAAADLLRQKESHLVHISRLATMGEMVAGIAHEINQPLHAANTFAEAARRNLQSELPDRVETAVDCMTEISHAIARTVQIIRRLREFVKTRPFQLEPTSLNDVVRESLKITGYELRRIGVAIRLQLADFLPPVHGDRIQLEQLVVNLIKNGCEAMERATVHQRIIELRTNVCDGKVALEVVDAGSGVEGVELHRLFEPFYTTKSDGMGMGLALCKSIAEAHKGELRVQGNASKPGLTFSLIVPVFGATL